MEARSPKVFISYSRESPEHADRVLVLADRLRGEGIDCMLDQYVDSPAEGWPRWMDEQLREANFVLVICTAIYNRRVEGQEKPGKGLGVRWESTLTYQHLYNAGASNERFIPILLDDASSADIPIPLQGATHYRLPTDYDMLYRRLTNQPLAPIPSVGKLRKMPPRTRSLYFLETIQEELQASIPPNPLELPQVDDGQLAASTRRMYERDRAAYVKFAKAKGFNLYDPKTLEAWRDEMMQDSHKKPKTINRMLTSIRRHFREVAQRDRDYSELAAKFRSVPMVKEEARKVRKRISREDMRRLCESPDIKTLVGIRDRALLATLASSGLKVSELASLTTSQIIRKDGGYLLSVRGNTDSEYRDAPLSQEAYSLIVKWLERRSINSPYVFTAFAGKGDRSLDTPISESGLWKCVVKYAKKCELQKVKPHDLRRFVGTQLAATGDLRKVKEALGHKHISVTAREYPLDQLPVGMTDNLY